MADDNTVIPANQTTLLVWVIVALSVLTVGGVVVVTVLEPQNTSAIPVIISLMTPILTALLAYAIHSMSTAINGRMTELIHATAEKEHVKGIVQGLIVNPNTALQASDLPVEHAKDLEKIKDEVRLPTDKPQGP